MVNQSSPLWGAPGHIPRGEEGSDPRWWALGESETWPGQVGCSQVEADARWVEAEAERPSPRGRKRTRKPTPGRRIADAGTSSKTTNHPTEAHRLGLCGDGARDTPLGAPRWKRTSRLGRVGSNQTDVEVETGTNCGEHGHQHGERVNRGSNSRARQQPGGSEARASQTHEEDEADAHKNQPARGKGRPATWPYWRG